LAELLFAVVGIGTSYSPAVVVAVDRFVLVVEKTATARRRST
jgi:hypothetical protein